MYLTLALACLCVGYSEWDLLPEATVLTGIVIVLLIVSYRTGERFELGLAAANRLGLVIGLVTAVWMAYQFINKNSLIYTLPWPASLLPYIGTLLMFLIPAKLFRPKHIGDWWTLQGMGMAATALASSMADDIVFGILLGVYSVVGLWSLTLFFYRRVAGHLPPIPNTTPQPLATVVSGFSERPGRRNLIRAAGWLVLAVGICLPLFLVTPRTDSPRFQMGKGRLETGYNSDQMIDLTRTGELQVNRDISFIVTAIQADGLAKTDLNPNQRWRGAAFNAYDSGRWTRDDPGVIFAAGVAPFGSLVSTPEKPFYFPNLGPETFTLQYESRRQTTDLILADPVAWDVDRPVPVAITMPEEPVRPWFQTGEGAFRPLITARPLPNRYTQVSRPVAAPNATPPDVNLGPPFELNPDVVRGIFQPEFAIRDMNGTIAKSRLVRLPRLRTWTQDLLERIARTNPAIQTALDRAPNRATLRIHPDDYEIVARALAHHLAQSGEYTYTTTLRRDDTNSDPVEEFLYKTKSGHCQRYAAGLVLMLRSVEIPANYILGYKGCEHDGDGVYYVREEHAHAWVEVLITRPAPPGFVPHQRAGQPLPGQPPRVWHWLSLDPTPDLSADDENKGWLGSAGDFWADLFRTFIVGYSPERRQKTLLAIENWMKDNWWWMALLVVLGAMAFGLRVALRRRQARLAALEPETGLPWYDDYRHTLAAHGYLSPSGRTAHEHAVVVSEALAARPATASVADVPLAITRAFYLTRYAKRPPSPDELSKLTAAIDQLRTALQTAPRT